MTFSQRIDERQKDGHKRHCCLYCKELVWKIARHIERRHKDEEEVRAILKLTNGGKMRKDRWKSIIRKGDYEFNLEAQRNDSRLLVVRQEKNQESSLESSYLPCTSCYGYFKYRKLYKHVKKCPFATKEDKESSRNLAASRALHTANNSRFSDVHQLILSSMRRDEKYLIIKNDESLLLLAATNLQAKEKERYPDIKYSLRVLAELVMEFRKVSGKQNAKSKELIFPENYDNVLQSAKQITGFKGPRNIEKPNVFRKLGFCLSNLTIIVRSQAHKEDCKITLEKCRSFLELYKDDWTIYSNNALATYHDRKGNVPDVLPDEDDVKLLRQYFISEMKRLCGLAETDDFKKSDYKFLSKVTLSMFLF